MATVRRPGAPAPPVAVVDNRVMFGEDAFYTAGGGAIPEGKYILYHDAVVHQYKKQDGTPAGPEFLAIRVSAYSFDDLEAEPKVGYYSMGGKAIKSFVPNPDDEGKSLLPVPGGPATTVNELSNWAIYRQGLLNSGMPQGVFTNDLRAIDGIWAHITNIPEPEARKGFAGASTGDAQPEPRKVQNIAVVSEILDGGAPWDGGGGIPEATPKTPAKAAGPARPGPRPAAAPAAVASRPGPRPAPVPVAAAPAAESTDDDLLSAAMVAAGTVIEASPDGMGKLVLKTGVFKTATKTNGAEVAQAILDMYFTSDAAIDTLLAELGYMVKGPRVVPISA